MKPRAPRSVAYFLRAFPKLSETFILGEIEALRSLGVTVRVIAMEAVREPRRHPEAAALLPEVTFVPEGMVSFPPRPPRRLRRIGPEALPASQRQYWRVGEWAARWIERWKTDHIHAHFAGPAATMGCAAAERSGASFSFTAHAKDIFSNRVDWTWLAELGHRAAAVVTVCEYNHRFLSDRIPHARIVRIHNGVDLERWSPRSANGSSRGTVRRRSPRSAGPRAPRVLAVGRLVPKKGFHVLIDAMALLRDRGLPVVATIVGDGVERAALGASIRDRRLGRRVRLRGGLGRDEILRLMRRAHLVVAPSVVEPDGNQDALPTVLLEAGACGVAAVATRVAGIPEIVRHGHTGLLVPPDDAAALAGAIESLLASRSNRMTMGRAARERIARRFDRRRATARLARLFAECPGLVSARREHPPSAGQSAPLAAAGRRA